MQQKVIQIGNSIGTIIPQFLNRDLGLLPGDPLIIERKGDQLILSRVKKTKRKIARGVDVKFMKMVDDFINEHEDVLKELANR
ncbi:MAG: hypothetical protein Q8Q49_01390 [bacterium]|nr:hypothetical protein [bacterium]